MPGRNIPPEATLLERGYGRPDLTHRRRVLHETLAAFEKAGREHYHRIAGANLARWKENAKPTRDSTIEVLAGDWGEVAGELTERVGACFAVLNMANAYLPGGAYVEGTAAQEENMFRRTDCHFQVGTDEYDPDRDRYRPEITELLSAANGEVLLDTEHPRVCIRGAEDRTAPDMGYPWLAEDRVFPFFELRAAAVDLRDGSSFDATEMGKRIAAQFDTMEKHGIRHAVLSAFGCGAFQNPAPEVATLYRKEIDHRRDRFTHVAFAIFAPGYGPDNYTPFAKAFRE